MKLKYILLALLPLCLANCSEEETITSEAKREVRVTAGIGTHSRMVLSDQGTYFNCLWQDNDHISLFTSTQSNLVYRTTLEEKKASAAFTPVDEALEDIEGNTVYACYPNVIFASGEGVVANLPSTQTINYNEGTLPSFAYATSTISNGNIDFKFKHISAFLCLTVTPDMLQEAGKAISKVTVSTTASKPLSVGEGDTFDFSNGGILTATHGNNSVVVNGVNQVVDSDWTIHIPILPQPAGAEITITMEDSEGTILYTQTKQTPENDGFMAGYAYYQGPAGSSDVAYLIDGPTFNTLIKELANGGDFEYWMSDEKIGRIKFVTSESSLPETKVLVSADDSPAPIYASFSETDSLLTISTQARDIKIENAKDMFQSLGALHTIDFGVFGIDEMTTSIAYMFSGCPALKTIETANWNTSNVTDMSFVFFGCSGLTSLEVSSWDTSKASYIEGVFSGCSGLTSLDVSGWNTTGVRSMAGVFFNCSGLTSLNVSSWDTSNVMDMSSMFNGCSALTSLDLTKWNTANVDNMYGMFSECSSATELKVSGWDTSNVTDMGVMFKGCSDLTSLDFTKWNTANVDNMNGMFMECSLLEKLDLSGWNTVSVTGMGDMFRDCSSLIELGLSTTWNTTNVDVMDRMFAGCSSLNSLDLSGWNTSNVIYMNGMFSDCLGLTSLKVSSWDTSNVMDMGSVFSGCSGLTSLDLSSWNTSKVTNMGSVFSGCSGLTSLNVSGWDTSKVMDMWAVFGGCSSLTSLDLSSWDTSNVTSMTRAFSGCSGLTQLNISNWSLNEETGYWEMFYHCAATSQNCRVTSSLATKEFLLARTDDTAMNPEWFNWDGSSYEDMPNQNW